MATVDPITTEIIRNAFISIAKDMNATLIRSAFTPVIYEGKDCSVALIDADGEVLGQSLGLPLFLGNLEICIKLIAEEHGWDYFNEGDVFYMNDSYMTGTHLNDSTIIMPIFWHGDRIGFAASRAHWLDVGAKDPGTPVDSHEIYQEGMRWGPTRLYENGKPREDVIDLLRRNSRFGEATVGDMNAQVAAGRTGEKRLHALFDRFGAETIAAARDEIFKQTEILEREAVRAVPDGVYHAEGYLEGRVGAGSFVSQVLPEALLNARPLPKEGGAQEPPPRPLSRRGELLAPLHRARERAPGRKGKTTRASAVACTSSGTPADSRPTIMLSSGRKQK